MSNNDVHQQNINNVKLYTKVKIKKEFKVGGCIRYYCDKQACNSCKLICVHSPWQDLQYYNVSENQFKITISDEPMIPRYSRTEGYNSLEKVHEKFKYITSQLETLQRNSIRSDSRFREMAKKTWVNNYVRDQVLLSDVNMDYFGHVKEFASFYNSPGILAPEVLIERNSMPYYAEALWNWIFNHYEFFKESIPTVLMLPVDYNIKRFIRNFKKVNQCDPQIVGFYKGRNRVERILLNQIKNVKLINPDIKVLLSGIESLDLITRFHYTGVDTFAIRAWERQETGSLPKFNTEEYSEQWEIANQLENTESNVKRTFELLGYQEFIKRLKCDYNGKHRFK